MDSLGNLGGGIGGGPRGLVSLFEEAVPGTEERKRHPKAEHGRGHTHGCDDCVCGFSPRANIQGRLLGGDDLGVHQKAASKVRQFPSQIEEIF